MKSTNISSATGRRPQTAAPIAARIVGRTLNRLVENANSRPWIGREGAVGLDSSNYSAGDTDRVRHYQDALNAKDAQSRQNPDNHIDFLRCRKNRRIKQPPDIAAGLRISHDTYKTVWMRLHLTGRTKNASYCSLAEMVARGQFREDLYREWTTRTACVELETQSGGLAFKLPVRPRLDGLTFKVDNNPLPTPILIPQPTTSPKTPGPWQPALTPSRLTRLD